VSCLVQVVQTLDVLTKQDLQQVYEEQVAPNSTSRRKLLVCVHSQAVNGRSDATPVDDQDSPDTLIVANIEEVKQSLLQKRSS
jgi:hypothetical protein